MDSMGMENYEDLLGDYNSQMAEEIDLNDAIDSFVGKISQKIKNLDYRHLTMDELHPQILDIIEQGLDELFFDVMREADKDDAEDLMEELYGLYSDKLAYNNYIDSLATIALEFESGQDKDLKDVSTRFLGLLYTFAKSVLSMAVNDGYNEDIIEKYKDEISELYDDIISDYNNDDTYLTVVCKLSKERFMKMNLEDIRAMIVGWFKNNIVNANEMVSYAKEQDLYNLESKYMQPLDEDLIPKNVSEMTQDYKERMIKLYIPKAKAIFEQQNRIDRDSDFMEPLISFVASELMRPTTIAPVSEIQFDLSKLLSTIKTLYKLSVVIEQPSIDFIENDFETLLLRYGYLYDKIYKDIDNFFKGESPYIDAWINSRLYWYDMPDKEKCLEWYGLVTHPIRLIEEQYPNIPKNIGKKLSYDDWCYLVHQSIPGELMGDVINAKKDNNDFGTNDISDYAIQFIDEQYEKVKLSKIYSLIETQGLNKEDLNDQKIWDQLNPIDALERNGFDDQLIKKVMIPQIQNTIALLKEAEEGTKKM